MSHVRLDRIETLQVLYYDVIDNHHLDQQNILPTSKQTSYRKQKRPIENVNATILCNNQFSCIVPRRCNCKVKGITKLLTQNNSFYLQQFDELVQHTHFPHRKVKDCIFEKTFRSKVSLFIGKTSHVHTSNPPVHKNS